MLKEGGFILMMLDFQKFLFNKGLSEENVNIIMQSVQKFKAYFDSLNKEINNLTFDDFYQYSQVMIDQEQNTHQNYVSLLHFGYFLNHHPLITAIMEVLDGWEMFPNLSKQMMEQFGQDFHDEIYNGIGNPPQGIHPNQKPPIIKFLVSRIIKKLGREESIHFFKQGLRDKYPSSYVQGIEKYNETHDIDEVLKFKHQNLLETITTHFRDHTLFFLQPITQQVLDFVRHNQRISAGIRKGNIIDMIKIPFMTDSAFNATSAHERNYYICHNPLIREALKKEDQPIDPIFCNCSGGFIKNYWEAVLGCNVDVELVDSVIMGGNFCRFRIHLPKEVLKNNSRSN